MIVFGTKFGGKVKQLDGQWIESKFFHVMFVPLIPVSTMFCTGSDFNKRNGFNIEMMGSSVGHGYLRHFLFFSILGLWGVNLFTNEYSFMPFTGYEFIILAGAFALLYAHSYFNKTKANGAEAYERKKLGLGVGLNALPEWLEMSVLKSLLDNLAQQVMAQFGNTTLTNIDVKTAPIEHVPLLYAYGRYLQAYTKNADEQTNNIVSILSNRFDMALQTGINGKNNFEDIAKKEMDDDFRDDVSTMQ